MRIGMMTDVYKPHISGITNYISLNKHYLEEAGHDVFVFTFGDLEHQDNEEGIIRSPGLPLVDTGYYLSLRYSLKAKRLLQTMDVVHIHHPFLSGNLALRYCRPLRIPTVFTNHTRYDLYAQAYLPLLPEVISETLLQRYMPSFCEAMDLVISPSPGMADVLCKLGVRSNIVIVPNGVELTRFHHLNHMEQRANSGFTEDDILFVYTGRLAPEKNLGLLIEAFAGAAEVVGNIHLLVIGGGPEEELLKDQAARSLVGPRIHFIGRLDYDLLPAYLTMCDAFVTASVTEVHPLSVIEAMASGLPVLGVRSVGVGDTIENGVTGFLASENPAAIAAQMTRMGLDRDLRRRMGKAARKRSEQYSIEHTTNILLSFYEQLVHKAATRKRGLTIRFRSLLERFRS
jgi:glycosyltransferase involved in cell wall biosynthesis